MSHGLALGEEHGGTLEGRKEGRQDGTDRTGWNRCFARKVNDATTPKTENIAATARHPRAATYQNSNDVIDVRYSIAGGQTLP